MMRPRWILLSWLTLAGAALAGPRVLVVPSFGDLPYQGVLAGIRQVALEVRVDSQALPPTILYNPAESAARAEALAGALRRAGLSPQLAEAPRPADITTALEHLHDRTDLLVSIPDLTVFNPITAKTIILFSYRYRVPVIGPSQAWARAGALFSLEWDYEEDGRYCGQLALKALGVGGRAQPQRKLLTSVNLRAAAQMHVVLPPDLVGMFSTVFD